MFPGGFLATEMGWDFLLQSWLDAPPLVTWTLSVSHVADVASSCDSLMESHGTRSKSSSALISWARGTSSSDCCCWWEEVFSLFILLSRMRGTSSLDEEFESGSPASSLGLYSEPDPDESPKSLGEPGLVNDFLELERLSSTSLLKGSTSTAIGSWR